MPSLDQDQEPEQPGDEAGRRRGLVQMTERPQKITFAEIAISAGPIFLLGTSAATVRIRPVAKNPKHPAMVRKPPQRFDGLGVPHAGA